LLGKKYKKRHRQGNKDKFEHKGEKTTRQRNNRSTKDNKRAKENKKTTDRRQQKNKTNIRAKDYAQPTLFLSVAAFSASWRFFSSRWSASC
jgi:hypothetical protein